MMARAQLYPLTFAPVLKEKIWGGEMIRTCLGWEYPHLANCGEAWTLSGIPGSESPVARGAWAGATLGELGERFGADLWGAALYARYGNECPVLVKFISTADDLSIQVHPDDAMARREHKGRGKAEMWYVLQADPGAGLLSGFVRPVSQQEYLQYFHSGRLEEILRRVEVRPGDCFYLPPGQVHAIGRGILLAEIQQASDITYRIYDYDRRDAGGNKRELHVEKALEAMDFSAAGDPRTHYRLPQGDAAVPLVEAPFFSTSLIRTNGVLSRELPLGESFTVYTCVEGAARIDTPAGECELKIGQCALIPACIARVEIIPAGGREVRLLETRPK